MAIKKYTNGSWVSASYRKYGTETDTIATLPATVIGDGTPISSYVIKGNMEQSGTPTPSNPIYPSECGDLVASGEHAGQYKLPLTLGSTTTDIYLGEVQSTRRIKKLVLDGTENWQKTDTANPNNYLYYLRGFQRGTTCVCSHLEDMGTLSIIKVGIYNTNYVIYINFGSAVMTAQTSGNTVAGLKEYLAQQYAAGTPVIIWYILAEPETAVVNEPIRKIDDYVDSVSGTNLATSGTAQELDVETTLKPSEVDLTYHGWHEHEDTKYST